MSKLEQANLVTRKDVLDAVAGLTYEQCSEDEDDARNDAVFERNSGLLVQALWNLLVVRLWVGLCHTDARDELH